MDRKLIEEIKEIVDKLDSLEDYFDSLPELQSNIDSLISDYRHLIRDYELNEYASIMIVKKLNEAELLRKQLKEHHDLFNVYDKNKGKLLYKDHRQFLLSELYKKEKEWQHPYKFRILSDDDINAILSEKKKRGRPKKEENCNEDIETD